MPSVQIRPFEGRDVHPTVNIWNKALPRDPVSVGRFASWLFADPDYRPGEDSGMFVAAIDDKPVGFLRAIIRRWPNDRVGAEPENGWIPVMAVDPEHQKNGIGRQLLDAALAYMKKHDRKHIWVCGNSGSAPGYVFPGVDKDIYANALKLMLSAGFVVDHEPVAMSGGTLDFDENTHLAKAWEVGKDIVVESLTPRYIQPFLEFLADAFPGDWNIAARAKIRSGQYDQLLIARQGDEVVGYCQWEGEHFGPFGVRETLRGGRIGAKLFVESVRRIRAADGRTVWFNWADPDAARFYSRFGLKPTRNFAILRCDL